MNQSLPTPVASKAENPPKQMEPTPRPWTFGYRMAGVAEIIQIEDRNTNGIAQIYSLHGQPGIANAELICRCVNNHDALLEALKSLLDSSDDLAARLVKENGILVTEAYAIATEKGYAVIAAAEKE